MGWLMALASASAWAVPGALIPVGAPWRYQLLAGGAGPTGWQGAGFDDSVWPSGASGFSVGLYGYDQAATVLPTSVNGMSVRGMLLRRSWVVEDPAVVEWLSLKLDYEDGVVAWLNGEEIFRRGLPVGVPFTGSELPATRFSGEVETLDLTPYRSRLVAGTNVLALHVLDAMPSGGTLFAWPELRANFLRGPLIQNVSQDQATVFWHSPEPVPAWVEYSRADGDLDAPPMELAVGAGTNSAVVLSGLQPGSRYRYRVGLSGRLGRVWSDPAEFTTLKVSGDLDFLVLGDTGSGGLAQYAVASAMEHESADLVLHTGDISYPVFSAGQIDLRCFSVYERTMREVPYFFTFGNHDFQTGEAAYLEAFWLPTNSVTRTEHYYSFDHGDAHFVSLFIPWYGVSQMGTVTADGSRSGAYRWLTNDLARTGKPWKFVFFHQPMRTSGPHILDDYDVDGRPDVGQIREALLPVFAQNGVQAVFCGHDHGWERFAPASGVQIIVTGGGGAVLYPLYRRDPTSAQFAQRHHFVRVGVRGDEARVEAVLPDGLVLDQFTLRQSAKAATPARVDSRWRMPVEDSAGVPNGDGNVTGEVFGLSGAGVSSVPGETANPGRLVVNHDGERVYVGLRDAMLGPGQTLLLFLGTPGEPGVARCEGVGASRGNPLSGLKLSFDGFQPKWVCLLGDELADGTIPDFRRRGSPWALGQGVFRMDAALTPVLGTRVRQFNRSPEVGPVFEEEDADFMVVSIPRSELEVEAVGAVLQIAGVVVVTPGDGVAAGAGPVLDTAYLGRSLSLVSPREWVVRSLEFVLAETPAVDRDADGLSEEEEARLGTDSDHPDSDRDRLPDGWEVAHRLNPLSDQGEQGRVGDPDGDGYTNEEEYRSGTDPRDGTPTLRVGAVREGSRLRLEWRAMLGREYDVEVTESLSGPFVSAGLSGFPRRASATNESAWVGEAIAGGGARWFRVRERR